MIAIPRPIDYQEEGYLRYFPGGREGVISRFGDAFRGRILGHFDELAEFYKNRWNSHVSIDTLKDIAKCDYQGLDCEVVHELMNLLSISISDGFGVPHLTESDKEKLRKEMKDKGFFAFCGTKIVEGKLTHANGNEVSSEGLLTMYLHLQALKGL